MHTHTHLDTMAQFFATCVPVDQKDPNGAKHFDDENATVMDRQISYAKWCVEQIPDKHMSHCTVFCLGKMNFYKDSATAEEICNQLLTLHLDAFYCCGKIDEKDSVVNEQNEIDKK